VLIEASVRPFGVTVVNSRAISCFFPSVPAAVPVQV
jgi:hypothetical protein